MVWQINIVMLKGTLLSTPDNCFNVFDHFMGLALKGLIAGQGIKENINNWYILKSLEFQDFLLIRTPPEC